MDKSFKSPRTCTPRWFDFEKQNSHACSGWTLYVCIDQSNLQERAEQVQLMTAIYQRATKVHIWLGESSHDGDAAIDFLEAIGGTKAGLQRFNYPHTDWYGPQFDYFFGIGPPLEERETELLAYTKSLGLRSVGDIDERGWTALESCFKRSYWNRGGG